MESKIKKLIYPVLFGCCIIFFLTGCSSLGNMLNWTKFWDSSNSQGGSLTEKDLAQFASNMRPARGNPDSHYLLACYYQERGRHIEAIEEFKKAILIDPSYVKAYNGMGVSCDLIGDYPRAIESYKKAVSLNPDLSYVQNNLGYSYLLQGNSDEAIAAFKKAIVLNNQEKRFHNNLGQAYAMNNRFDLAMEEFKLAGDEGKAHYNIAQLYYKKGLYKEAKSNYAKAIEQDPSLARAQNGLQAAEAMARISPQPVVSEAKKEELVAPAQPSLIKNEEPFFVSKELPSFLSKEEPSFVSKVEPEALTPAALISLNPDPAPAQIPAVEEKKVVYEVQVASTRSPHNANFAVKSLQRSGYRASIRNWKSEEGNEWHRITVGSFETKDEALTLKQKIEKEFEYKPVIIQSTSVVHVQPAPLLVQSMPVVVQSAPVIQSTSVRTEAVKSFLPDQQILQASIEQLPPPKEAKVEISNGNGVRRMARRVGNYLTQNGVRVVRLTNAKNFKYPQTKIYYLEGYREAAYQLANQMPGIQKMEVSETFNRPTIRIKVLIGTDLIPYHKVFADSRAKFANFNGSHKKSVQVVMNKK